MVAKDRWPTHSWLERDRSEKAPDAADADKLAASGAFSVPATRIYTPQAFSDKSHPTLDFPARVIGTVQWNDCGHRPQVPSAMIAKKLTISNMNVQTVVSGPKIVS